MFCSSPLPPWMLSNSCRSHWCNVNLQTGGVDPIRNFCRPLNQTSLLIYSDLWSVIINSVQKITEQPPIIQKTPPPPPHTFIHTPSSVWRLCSNTILQKNQFVVCQPEATPLLSSYYLSRSDLFLRVSSFFSVDTCQNFLAGGEQKSNWLPVHRVEIHQIWQRDRTEAPSEGLKIQQQLIYPRTKRFCLDNTILGQMYASRQQHSSLLRGQDEK